MLCQGQAISQETEALNALCLVKGIMPDPTHESMSAALETGSSFGPCGHACQMRGHKTRGGLSYLAHLFLPALLRATPFHFQNASGLCLGSARMASSLLELCVIHRQDFENWPNPAVNQDELILSRKKLAAHQRERAFSILGPWRATS